MTKRTGDLAKRETGGVTAGTGQATGWAGPVTPAHGGTVVHPAVPAQLAAAVAAAGSLALLGRAAASISFPSAGGADPAREQGREAPAPPPGAAGGAVNTAQRPR